MAFLNGLLVWGAILGSVPIIIHLMNRRRFKVVVWAAMEFLLATMEKNSRRLQIQDLILMMLRAFALIFLALALARPTITSGRLSVLAGGKTAAVIVLDNSLSMDYHDGREKRFETAQRMASTVVESLPKGSQAALVLMSDVAVAEIPKPIQELDFVRAEIQRAPLSDGGTDVLAALSKAWQMLNPDPDKGQIAVSREIYLITDMQANGWPQADNGDWRALVEKINAARPAVKIFLMDAGSAAAQNVSVAQLKTQDEIVTTGLKTTFKVTLRNHGQTPAEGVVVDLLVSDAPDRPLRKAASIVVDLVQTVADVSIETRFARGGNHRVVVRTGIDRLAADNSRYVSVDVIDRVRMLLIDGQPGDSDDASSDETYFLRTALSPIDPDSEDGKTLIETEVTTVYGLGGKRLRDYHAVVLANVGDLPKGLVDGLKTFVRAEGGGLIVFLGDNVRAQQYNAKLFTEAGLLPGKLGTRIIERDREEDAGFGFATDGLSHPIVSFFNDKETMPFLARPRFYRAFSIEVAEDADGSGNGGGVVQVVARFTGGTPAIVERKIGRGSVLLFASSADKEWNDFPLRPAFVPVMRRAAQHVALGRRPRKTIRVNDRIIDVLGARDAGALVTVRDPRKNVRQVSATAVLDRGLAQVQVGSTHFAGFYELTVPGRVGEEPRVSYFAANPPYGESDLTAYTEADLRNLAGLDFQWINRRDDLRRIITEKRVGREIWPFLLALTFLCLLAESYLAVRWAPRET